MSKTDQQILHLEHLIEEIKNLQKTLDAKNFTLATLQGEKEKIIREYQESETDRIQTENLNRANQKYLSEMAKKQANLVSEAVSKTVQEVSSYLDSHGFRDFLRQVVARYESSLVSVEVSDDMQETLSVLDHIQKKVVEGNGIFRINFENKVLNFDKQNMLMEIADQTLAKSFA